MEKMCHFKVILIIIMIITLSFDFMLTKLPYLSWSYILKNLLRFEFYVENIQDVNIGQQFSNIQVYNSVANADLFPAVTCLRRKEKQYINISLVFWLQFVGFHYWHDEQSIYVNLSSVLLNYDSKLPAAKLTLVTSTVNCSSKSSSPFKMPKISSKSSPHKNRSSTLSAILNEVVHGQSHVTDLFNIRDRSIVFPFEFFRLS